jgi:nucleoside-diphosphate-sugar epimerase
MNVLVTGASGWIGQALVRHLRAQGYAVRGAVRQRPLPDADHVQVGDIDELTDWRAALSGCEVVVHTAARVHDMHSHGMQGLSDFMHVNVYGTENLVRQAAIAGVKRFVFLSSIKAMGEQGLFQAQDACHPRDAYGLSKLRAEHGVQRITQMLGSRELGPMEWVVLRLPLVYGSGVKANFARLMHWVSKAWPLPLADVRNTRSMIGLPNLLDLITVCLGHPGAAQQVFLPSDGEPVSTPELIRAMALSFKQEARLWAFPPWGLRLLGALLGKKEEMNRLIGSLTVNDPGLWSQLGWRPPWRLAQVLDAMVAESHTSANMARPALDQDPIKT